MKGKITPQRLIRRMCILPAIGMDCSGKEAKRILMTRGVFGHISWMTRILEKDCDWMYDGYIQKFMKEEGY